MTLLLLLPATACMEPPKYGQMDLAVSSLQDLYTWDPVTKAAGQASYDAVMGRGPEILPFLVDHLTDMTPTQLHEPVFDIKVTVGDVCFLILLDLTNLSWKKFADDGVFVSTQIPNPIFCVRFDNMAARHKVKARFAKMLEEQK